MSDAVEFFVALIPRRKNRLIPFRVGNFAKNRPDEKGVEAQATLASACLPNRPPTPFTGPVRLDVAFRMPIPGGWPEWKRTAAIAGTLHHTKRPDRGNLLKLLEDALRGAFYSDDSLVVAGDVSKSYGQIPGYEIRLTPLVQATKPERAPKSKKAKASEMVVVSQGPVAVVETPFVREPSATPPAGSPMPW